MATHIEQLQQNALAEIDRVQPDEAQRATSGLDYLWLMISEGDVNKTAATFADLPRSLRRRLAWTRALIRAQR